MATGKREMTPAELALVGKWGVFRNSWGGSVASGRIVKFTAQRVYTERKFNPTPRERASLLAVFETEREALRSTIAYDKAYRDGMAAVNEARAAVATANAAQTAGAETAAVVGSLPVPKA